MHSRYKGLPLYSSSTIKSRGEGRQSRSSAVELTVANAKTVSVGKPSPGFVSPRWRYHRDSVTITCKLNSSAKKNMAVERDFDQQTVVDLKGKLDYSDYLHLDELVACQHPLSAEHDEMLFIVQHQVSELWMKLIIHELRAAMKLVRNNDLEPAFKIIARIKQIIRQLFEQWGVLETLTPSEYVKFRHVFGPASGMQSAQYRTIEFLLGNKDAKMIQPFAHKPETYNDIKADLEAPSLYDEFIMYLGRQGFDIPGDYSHRDFSNPHETDEQLTRIFFDVYSDPEEYWSEYEMAEKLVDVDAQIAQWRFRHMKTVERVIGMKRGTGGTSGVQWLQKVIFVRLFPELWDVRTLLEEPQR